MEERLTEYFECGAYVDKSNIVDISQVAGQFFEKGAYMGKAIDKLGAFEDFMEEQNIPDLKTLSNTLHKVSLELEKIQALKDRWEKLKEWVNEFHRDVVAVYPKTLLNKMQELEQGE